MPAPDGLGRASEQRERGRPDDRRQQAGGNRPPREREQRLEAPPRGSGGPNLEFSLPVPDVRTRVVVGKGANARVQHDDDRRFEMGSGQHHMEQMQNGGERAIFERPDGARVITERDRDGNILRRLRERPDGNQVVIIDNQRQPRPGGRRHDVDLPPLKLDMPRDRYILDGRQAGWEAYRDTLDAAPVEQIERAYSLDEIRDNQRLRAKLRRVDLAVKFATGSAAIPRDQFDTLSRLGEAIENRLPDAPDEVFLIEGHTDAVGDDISNLRLSDARAESVAYALTDYFKIPPENLIVQGYGEQYLKVNTQGPSAENRRVSVRRITPLLRGSSDG